MDKKGQSIHKGFGFLFEMGCGKTITAISVAGTAYQMGKIRKLLVVAPTSVCSVWPKEFDDYAGFRYCVKVLLGTKDKRIRLLDDLDAFPYEALKVAVINYESTWREGVFEALLDWDADMVTHIMIRPNWLFRCRLPRYLTRGIMMTWKGTKIPHRHT